MEYAKYLVELKYSFRSGTYDEWKYYDIEYYHINR